MAVQAPPLTPRGGGGGGGGGADPKRVPEGRYWAHSEEEKERNINKSQKTVVYGVIFNLSSPKNRNVRGRYARKSIILFIFKSTGAPKKNSAGRGGECQNFWTATRERLGETETKKGKHKMR